MKVTVWLCVIALGVCTLMPLPTAAGDLDERADPQKANVRVSPLASLLDYVADQQLDIRSLLLARDGQLAFEWHSALSSQAHNHQVFSVTKSVVSLLLGQALSLQARFSLTSKVSSVFSTKIANPSVAGINLEHLLMMRSGLPKTRAPASAFKNLHGASDRIQHVLALRSISAADTRFQYGNAESQLLAGAIEAVSSMKLLKFAERALFKPLGFRNHRWMHPDQQGLVTGGYGLRLRAIDMAKLGQLALQRGAWAGHQLVPAAYVRRATSAGPNAFYGYQWWTRVSAGGNTSYAALGVRGQVIQVVPALKLVFVMTADLPRSQARSVRRVIMDQFVVSAANGTRDTADAQRRLERARQRMLSYKPVSLRAQNLPRNPSTDNQ